MNQGVIIKISHLLSNTTYYI